MAIIKIGENKIGSLGIKWLTKSQLPFCKQIYLSESYKI
jgi:hypothetical protein